MENQASYIAGYLLFGVLDEDETLAGLGVRKDYYRNYKIYYVIDADTIYIVRILHMLVDSKAWLYRTFGV
jgi:plasmid stabilization system protein ParE